jgi:hypothetical protein
MKFLNPGHIRNGDIRFTAQGWMRKTVLRLVQRERPRERSAISPKMRLAGMSSGDSDGECAFFQASAEESGVHWRIRQIDFR